MNNKYRKKPVIINAIQFLGKNGSEIYNFMRTSEREICVEDIKIRIKTLEGEMTADINDWIIKGIKGEFYPCKPDIFEATYELVTD